MGAAAAVEVRRESLIRVCHFCSNVIKLASESQMKAAEQRAEAAVLRAEEEMAKRVAAAELRAEEEMAKRKAAEQRAEEEENIRKMEDGTLFLTLCELNLAKSENFSQMAATPPHKRPVLWDNLLKKIPVYSLEYEPNARQRASLPNEVRKCHEDVFGCSSKIRSASGHELPDEKFPAAHILAQGRLCRDLLKETIQYLSGGEKLSDFQMKRLLHGFKKNAQSNNIHKHCVFQQPYNFIRYRNQFVSWDTRCASIFYPQLSWQEQLAWDRGQEYSVFFLALTPRDFCHADPLKGNRVEIVDLDVDENRKQFDDALKAAAEGCVEILRRNLPAPQSQLAETPAATSGAAGDARRHQQQRLRRGGGGGGVGGAAGGEADQEQASSANDTEPFDGKRYMETLTAIAKQDHVYTLSSKGIPKGAKVLRVNFTSKTAPHPAFLTVKGINALVNINCMKGMIKGLTFSSKKAAIAIPGCLSLEGPKTSCGLCRFYRATMEGFSSCESLADYFTSSDEDSCDDAPEDARVDESATSSALRGESLLSASKGGAAAPSPRGDSKAPFPSGPNVALREPSPNTT